MRTMGFAMMGAAMLGIFAIQAAEAQLPAGLKKGQEFRLDFVRGKVIQVLGPTEMLVGLEKSNPDKYDGKGKPYGTLVIIQRIKTDGIADGDLLDDWRKEIGSDWLKVVGTRAYKLAGGGTRTFYVAEPK